MAEAKAWRGERTGVFRSVLGMAVMKGTGGYIRMHNIDGLSGMSYLGVRTSPLRPQEEIPSYSM